MDNNENKSIVKNKYNKKEKKDKDKTNKPKKGIKNKKQLVEPSNKKEKLENEKNSDFINNNENKEIVVIQKETEEKGVKHIKSSKKNSNIKIEYKENKEERIDSSPNIDLKLQINEKIEKIKELSFSQEINKKTLTELLKKVSLAIESNADLLYSINSNNNEDKEIRIKKLEDILEKRKNENNKIKEINKKYKKKYEYIVKDMNMSSLEKFDYLHKRINALKENNSILSKEISLINHKFNIAKMGNFNPKYKVSDIDKYSDEYVILTKEKYKQHNLLKQNKLLIKDVILKFQNLIQIVNEKKDEIKNLDLEKEINNLKQDLSGDEENIYNKIILNKTIILENYYQKNIRGNNSPKNLKSLIASRTKKFLIKNKFMPHSKSSLGSPNFQKKIDNNFTKIIKNKKIMDFNDYDLNNIDYNIISNNDFNDISSKKQKYLNLTEKLDKTINDISLFYENRTKEISTLIDMNSKKLSNIQQENELLKSEISDMRRILELNKKKHKLMNINNRNNFNKKYEESMRKLNICKDINIPHISLDNKDIIRENKLDKIKKKYITKNKITLFQKDPF